MVVTYCTAQEVAATLRFKDGQKRGFFSEDTDPTLDDVEEYINAAEDEMDLYTGRAWRSVTITDKYYYPKGEQWMGRSHLYMTYTTIIHLEHSDIRALSSATDKIEYFNGSSWVDILATGTQGDGFTEGDFWLEPDRGVLYFFSTHPRENVPSVRLTYRYGMSVVPKDINRACRLLAGIQVLETDWFTRQFPSNISGPDAESMAEKWEERAYKLLERHRRFQTY